MVMLNKRYFKFRRVQLQKVELTATTLRPLPGKDEPKRKRVVKIMSLAEACTKHGFSLSHIDEGVRKKFLAVFIKAGKTYVQIL